MLYNEGWYFVTSSSRALDYAKEKSIISSKTALQKAAGDAARHTADYKESVKTDVRDAATTGKDMVASGTALSGRILDTTHELAKSELAYARDNFKKAADSFVRGNLSIAARTEEDRRELADLPGNYFRTLKGDFSNIFELAESARKRFSRKIDPAWETAFQKASREFRAEYEKSGGIISRCLVTCSTGISRSFYHGFAAPRRRRS
jgi:hypothetical protein